MSYNSVFNVKLHHIVPHPPMGSMPKRLDDILFYTKFHNHHDNFKAIQMLWKMRENPEIHCDQEHSIHLWYE